MVRQLVLMLGLLRVSSIGLTAKSTSGTFRGVVKDESGNVLPGAEVTMTNADTKAVKRAITNEKGEYAFVEVPAGTYTVGAWLKGFLNINYLDFKLKEGKTVPIDFTLPIDAPVRSLQPRGRWIPLSGQ